MTVGVGVVGCGYQGSLLARAVERTEGLDVVAAADLVPETATRLVRSFPGARTYRTLTEMLGDAAVRAVVIATPHDVLASLSAEAASAGRHVLVEKPVATDADHLDALEAAVAKADVRCMAGYSLRFFPAHELLRQLADARTIGQVHAVTAAMGMEPLIGWKASAASGGGALLFLGSHVVDTVCALLGAEPQEVVASVTYPSKEDADATAIFQMRLGDATLVQVLVTQRADSWFDYVHLYGSHGRVSLTSTYWLQSEVSVVSSHIREYSEPTTIRPRVTDDPIMTMLVRELTEFAEAIRDHREPCVGLSDARRVLRILDGVRRAGETRAPVRLV